MTDSPRKAMLKELLAKVEAGYWGHATSGYCLLCFNDENFTNANKAYHGSFDAAMALHNAVLPDEGWEVYRTAKYPGMIPGSCPSPYKAIVGWGTTVSGHADNPARALFIADIKALIAQEGE